MRCCLRSVSLLTLGMVSAGCFQEPVVIMPQPSSADGTTTGPPDPSTTTDAVDTTAAMMSTASTGSSSDGLGSDSTTSSDASTSSESSSGSSSEDTGCAGAEMTELIWAEDAVVVAPMELREAIYLPGKPMMARSYVFESGTATFSFELGCPATVMMHGLLWDFVDGHRPENPDSFFITIDEEPEDEWDYGCQTEGMGDEHWAWLPMQGSGPLRCTGSTLLLELSAGPHTLVLRNREMGGGENFAAIAALVITSDLAFDPTILYEPNP